MMLIFYFYVIYDLTILSFLVNLFCKVFYKAHLCKKFNYVTFISSLCELILPDPAVSLLIMINNIFSLNYIIV